jgi:hypothetical protein
MQPLQSGEVAQRCQHLLDVMIDGQVLIGDRLRWFSLPAAGGARNRRGVRHCRRRS